MFAWGFPFRSHNDIIILLTPPEPMTPSEMLAQILSTEFENCHEMSAGDDVALDVKGRNAFVQEHLGDLEELVANFVAERF